ncbi:tRNA pseudouridine(38-40) synthase TruA [Abyssisolibacter fermentans]|uniref:tRNA pseudouridine(38-40) synthase TruA n=1 Tax=Abyssisolibacter fermentans TaxID=1766203 RepID=UPI00082D5ACA|nr:tRNA pseudouridine(38-40) synthase TruA [Abyssisolibacter fermentans]
MRNVKLIIEYDGTMYNGWQKQPDCNTVESEIEKAIYKITKAEVKIYGSGRTDRGVHAYGQVCNFYTNSKIPCEKMKMGFNSVLPKDIVIKYAEDMDSEFHSRYHAVGKQYRYRLYNDRVRRPLLENRAYHVYKKLDLDKMKIATKYFLGTHDFESFMSKGSSAKTTIRTIHSLDMVHKDEYVEFRIKGDGFLYNMVRIIIGTLVDVGLNKKEPEDIINIIEAKDRRKAGKSAPAHGLYLYEVYYE